VPPPRLSPEYDLPSVGWASGPSHPEVTVVVKTFGPDVTVQYQPAYSPQAEWEQGTVADFCEAIGLDVAELEAPGADGETVLQMPEAVVDREVVAGSALDEHLAECLDRPTMMFLSTKDGVPTLSILSFLNHEFEDPDVMNGLWLESEDRSLFIIPADDLTDHDEVIGPEDTEQNEAILDALMKLWIEFTAACDIPADRYEALGLTKVDDCLKRWNAVDGYYHA